MAKCTCKFLGIIVAIVSVLMSQALKGQETDLQRLEQKFQQVEISYWEINRDCRNLKSRVESAAKTQDPEQLAQEIVSCSVKTRDLNSRLVEANRQQLSLISDIRSYSDRSNLLTQESTKCSSWLNTLDKYGRNMHGLKRQLSDNGKSLLKALERLPAPDSFITENGVNMVLVPGLHIYVSQKPISGKLLKKHLKNRNPKNLWQGNIDFVSAIEMCKRLSMSENLDRKLWYRLPTAEEIPGIQGIVELGNFAVWLQSNLFPKNTYEFDMQKRFGVTMVSFWDPFHVITTTEAPNNIYRELPYATYDNLGVIVVASAALGKEQRLENARQTLKSTEE